MGHRLTGGHGLLPSGCGRRILSVFITVRVTHWLAVFMWDSYLQKHVEGQSQKGCCWKQDLETYFWFPVSVWGWACACVVFLFFDVIDICRILTHNKHSIRPPAPLCLYCDCL